MTLVVPPRLESENTVRGALCSQCSAPLAPMTIPRDGDQLVCYPRRHADLHATLLRQVEGIVAGAGNLTPDQLGTLKRTVDRLHLLTRSDAPWPVPDPPESPVSEKPV